MSTSPTNKKLPTPLFPLKPITVVVGHYGVGKTNLSLNLAYDSTKAGSAVALADLDVVNPYFRSSDYSDELSRQGIHPINPVFAGSTLDVPSLSGELYTYIESAASEKPLSEVLIIDAGGDDVGATALGRFAKDISTKPYEMLYIVNAFRSLTQTPEEAAALLGEIEEKSGLKATGVVNNSHLQAETTEETIISAISFGEKAAALCGLPLMATTIPAPVLGNDSYPTTGEDGSEPKSSVLFPSTYIQNPYVVQVYVHTPWEQ